MKFQEYQWALVGRKTDRMGRTLWWFHERSKKVKLFSSRAKAMEEGMEIGDLRPVRVQVTVESAGLYK